MSEQSEIPKPHTYLVTLTDGTRDDKDVFTPITKLVMAHDYGVAPNGAVVFRVFEVVAGVGPGWVNGQAFNQHEWSAIERINEPASTGLIVS